MPDYTIVWDTGREDEEGVDFGEVDDCGDFEVITMGDDVELDVTDQPGYPEIPFFSLNLLLPDDVTDFNLIVENSDGETIDVYRISPAKYENTWEEEGVYGEYVETCYNEEYYAMGTDALYPNGFCTEPIVVSNIYRMFGTMGVTVSIFPFSYYPDQYTMDILRDAKFYIEFDGEDLCAKLDQLEADDSFEAYATKVYYDNFNEKNIVNNSGKNGDYLIVAAHRDMEKILQPYVNYKRAQQYETKVVYLDEQGYMGDPFSVLSAIYTGSMYFEKRPDFVLLVGSISDIPASLGGDDMGNPYRDDDYHPMIGRWVVDNEDGNYDKLRALITKTIETEIGYVNREIDAVLFSGTDNRKRVSKKFYRNIRKIKNRYLEPMGISCRLYDGRNYEGTGHWSEIESELNETPRFFVYRGHGNFYQIADPYNLCVFHLEDLQNTTPAPIGFGFACALNSYWINQNFGASWVAANHGGVAFYGATVDSNRDANNRLAKRMFRELKRTTKKIGNFPLSLWLYIGEQSYYYGFCSATRKNQIEKYVLMGDPTLHVYGMDNAGNLGTLSRVYKPSVKTPIPNNAPDSKYIKIEVYDVSGNLLQINPTIATVIEQLPTGVYILRMYISENYAEIKKIVK